MSALGQKQTLAPQKAMFALPLKADMCARTRKCLLSANRRQPTRNDRLLRPAI